MKKRSFQDEINRNKALSVMLVILVMGGVMFLGWFIGWVYDPAMASTALIISAFIAILMSWVGYYNSDKLVLATIQGEEASPSKYREYHNLVDGLCIGAGMPKPRLYVINSPDINAFATGRDPEHAVIGVTKGALHYLEKEELEGVLAHELSHIQNYDTRFMTLVATMVGVIVILSELFRRSMWYGGGRDRDRGGNVILFTIGLLFAILSPLIMNLVKLAVSRKREYLADSSAVRIARNPDALADALEKIGRYNQGRLKTSKAVNHLFISNPLSKTRNLFSTHPPLTDRVSRLRNM